MQPAPFRQLPGDDRHPASAFWVQAEDGVKLRMVLWQALDPCHGTILLFPGRTEYAEKYASVAQQLNSAGHDVLTVDWRGQGLSDRLQDDPLPGHIGDFGDYQRDVIEMIVAGTQLDLPRPWHLLAHSMGGCIGLAALHGGLPVERAVFSSPMWGIDLGRIPLWLARSVTHMAIRFGHGGRLAPAKNGDSSLILDAAFNDNTLTHDIWGWTQALREAATWPDMIIGGPSHAWLSSALAECRRLAQLPAPSLPALIAAGTADRIISLPAIHQLSERWDRADFLSLDGARHELMQELPETRSRFIEAALAHLRN